MDYNFFIEYFKQLSLIMNQNKEFLIDLDSIVGDGDLGLTMSDGFNAAYNSIQNTTGTDLGKLFYTAGKSMSIAVPSTMGTLMASGLMNIGKSFKGIQTVSSLDIPFLFESYLYGVMNRGKAQIGEKTFLDGLYPAVEKMKEQIAKTTDLLIIANEAVAAAKLGFENTTNMLAIHGRAAIRGEESRTFQDPGAAVAYLMICAFKRTVDITL